MSASGTKRTDAGMKSAKSEKQTFTLKVRISDVKKFERMSLKRCVNEEINFPTSE